MLPYLADERSLNFGLNMESGFQGLTMDEKGKRKLAVLPLQKCNRIFAPQIGPFWTLPPWSPIISILLQKSSQNRYCILYIVASSFKPHTTVNPHFLF